MPYEIGRVFSDAVFSAVERARDRAAANPGSIRRERRPRDTSLDEAMVRAAQDERENQVRRELGLADLAATRERDATKAGLDRADLDRRLAADAATADYREGTLDLQSRNADSLDAYRGGMLDLREQEGADRAARYADRGRYERGVLAVREQEAAADVARAQTAQEAAALRAAAENVRSVQSAQSLLLRARDLATRPDSMGKVDPARAAAFVAIIKDLERFLRDPAGKNLPADVSAAARKARADVAARSGLGGVDEGDEVDPLLDLGLGDFGSEADAPPRLGR